VMDGKTESSNDNKDCGRTRSRSPLLWRWWPIIIPMLRWGLLLWFQVSIIIANQGIAYTHVISAIEGWLGRVRGRSVVVMSWLWGRGRLWGTVSSESSESSLPTLFVNARNIRRRVECQKTQRVNLRRRRSVSLGRMGLLWREVATMVMRLAALVT
jgi:hypothetical protein